MTHKSYILSVCEGTKIDAATLAALTNTAWDEVRRKVEEYKVSGYPPEQIQEMLIKVAAYHDAAYHAVTQELVARGISIRRAHAEENAIKDRADKEARLELAASRKAQNKTNVKQDYTSDQLETGQRRPERKKSVDPNRSSAKSSDSSAKPRTAIDGYSVKERKVLKLVCSLIPPNEHPSSMAQIFENLCKADGLSYTDVLKKFDLYGRPSA
jgi:hypothetical protein